MPTRAGTPIDESAAPGYVGPAHPFNWLDISGQEFLGIQQSALMRGQPIPLSYWQQREIAGPRPAAQGQPYYVTSRPYSRGADAHAPHFGQIAYNPIGGGTYNPYKLPVIAGPGARYTFGAIWFNVQAVPTSINMGPTVPIETINALIATSYVGAEYVTTG
jgi:hypothetical protein